MKKLIFLIVFIISKTAFAVSINNINSTVSGRAQYIQFSFDSAPSAPKVFIAGNDLVLDFYQTDYAQQQKSIEISNGYIHRITLVSLNGRTRIMVAGGSKYKYSIESKKNAIVLQLSDQIGQSGISQYKVGVIDLGDKKGSNDYSITVKDVKFTRDDNGGGVVEVNYSGDTKLDISKERLGNSLIVTLMGVNYSDSLFKKLDTTDFDTPIKYVNIKGANGRLKLELVNRNSWDYALYQLQNKLVINVRNLSKNNSTSSIPSLKAGGSDKVSFNFQNIDVRALLQLLADFSGYNILVSDSVTGTISIKLNNVPWDQALQTILSTKGLDMRRDGNVIRIAPASELAAINKQQQDSQKSYEAVEPLDTLTIRLKYAQATAVQSMILKPATSGGGATASLNSPNQQPGTSAPSASLTGSNQPNQILSSRGSILTDSRTNTLIVNDTPSRLKDIKELIDKIDIPVKQVLIEARIVEATSYFEKDLGTRLLLAGVSGNLTIANTLENGVTINQQGINVISSGGAAGGGTATGGGAAGGASSYVNQDFGISNGASLAAIFTPNSNTLIGLEVDALELQNQGRTISSPKVMTANYQPANIQQGVQIPYQQASSAGNTNVAFVNATLSLQVTPQITDDGFILLNINIQKNTPSPTLQVQGTPAINTNSVTTQVRVKDGSTILVGGIYVDDQQKVLEQIPYLGDIPYLGWLFKSQQTVNSKRELLIFITPRVIANSLENDS